VKQKTQLVPNGILKRMREQQGWSRNYVANQLGTDANTIGRWERGERFPSPYFRQRLCELFGASAQDLGLMPKSTDSSQQGLLHPPADGQFASSIQSNITLPLTNLSIRRNSFFTGRQQVLQRLHHLLKLDQTDVLNQALALTGLGGVGKTQTVLEYAYRYAQQYQAIFWARAETSQVLLDDMVSIAQLLQLSDKNEKDQLRMAHAVKHWLHTHSDWLLILDNVEDFALINAFLPTGGQGHILFTTRTQATSSFAHAIELMPMEPEEGMLFLLHRAKLLRYRASLQEASYPLVRDAHSLFQLLGGLPLALDQAGAYIEETGCSLSDYLDRYQSQQTLMLNLRGQVPITHHPDSVWVTLVLCIKRLEQVNSLSLELLRFCAFLHPDAIPEELLVQEVADLIPLLHPIVANPVNLDIAVADLRKFSLLRRNSETKLLTMHRLVQTVLKDEMDEDTHRQWAERTVYAVNRAFPDGEDFDAWPRCQVYLAHAYVCATLIEDWRMLFPEASSLLSRVGKYLRIRGQFTQAEVVTQQALSIREQVLNAEHSDVTQSIDDLGLVYYYQGKYAQAEALWQRVLGVREQMLGPDHPDVAQSLSNLGEIYYLQRKYAQAEALYQRILRIREQMLGPDHPNVAQSLNSLGVIYFNQGKLIEAEALLERALKIREQTSGPHHPLTAAQFSSIGRLYLMQGKYMQAEQLFLSALTIFEEVEGPDDPDVAFGLTNLAELYIKRGEYTRAEPLYLRALAIREKTLGPEHPWVANTLSALAKLYHHQGKYTQAEQPYLRALAIYQQKWSSEHPDIVTLKENYTHLLEEMNRKTESVSTDE